MPGILKAQQVAVVVPMQARFALASYFLLGAGVLAAWNAFITAADYYNAIYPVSDSAAAVLELESSLKPLLASFC